MALPTDYDSLKTWLLDWLDRPNMTNADEFVKLAESEMNARIRVRWNEAADTLALAQGADDVALPTDYLEMISLGYTDSGWGLDKRDRRFIDALRNNPGVGSGRPQWYFLGASTIDFEKPADRAYSLAIRYFQKWDVETDDTNWILVNHPAIYLGLALRRASMYVKDQTALQIWVSEAERDIELLNARDRKDRSKGQALRVDSALAGRGGWDIRSGDWSSN